MIPLTVPWRRDGVLEGKLEHVIALHGEREAENEDAETINRPLAAGLLQHQ